MIIYKHISESTEDLSVFNARVEIETDKREEWEDILNRLSIESNVVECDTVCHCRIRQNAEIIAQILDYDIRGEVAPYVPFFPNEVDNG